MTYLQLFWEFFKTGLFSVGGGLATLPFLRKMGEQYGWFTQEELANMLAVSESTPGPIGVNMATYVGTTATNGNPLGGVLATFALVLPSFLIMVFIAKMLARYRTNRYVDACFRCIRPVSLGLIGAAALSVMRIALLDTSAGLFPLVPLWPYLALFAALAVARYFLPKLHPIVFIAAGAAAGIILNCCGVL